MMTGNVQKWFWLVLGFVLFSPRMEASETYVLDPMHTSVLWHINHFGFSNPSGKWMAQGSLQWDKDDMSKSKVEVDIKVADIATGLPELNKHLKSPLFFDVAKFPQATFVSDKVKTNGQSTLNVYGTLTVHGVSKPVILEVTLNKSGKNPITDKDTIGFSGKTSLKRSDFGLNTLLPGLGDEVTLDIQAEAYKND